STREAGFGLVAVQAPSGVTSKRRSGHAGGFAMARLIPLLALGGFPLASGAAGQAAQQTGVRADAAGDRCDLFGAIGWDTWRARFLRKRARIMITCRSNRTRSSRASADRAHEGVFAPISS